MEVVWSAAALDDRQRILSYLLEHNPAATAQLEMSFVQLADALASFPNRGRPGRAPGTRELVAAYPYVLVYTVAPALGTVRILRVWHSAQDR